MALFITMATLIVVMIWACTLIQHLLNERRQLREGNEQLRKELAAQDKRAESLASEVKDGGRAALMLLHQLSDAQEKVKELSPPEEPPVPEPEPLPEVEIIDAELPTPIFEQVEENRRTNNTRPRRPRPNQQSRQPRESNASRPS